jgi:hypothetical protein
LGWIIDYDKKSQVLVLDENKYHCVCPIVASDHGMNSFKAIPYFIGTIEALQK